MLPTVERYRYIEAKLLSGVQVGWINNMENDNSIDSFLRRWQLALSYHASYVIFNIIIDQKVKRTNYQTRISPIMQAKEISTGI